MGLPKLNKAQRLDALHEALVAEYGEGHMVPPKIVKRVLFRGLGLVSTQTWQATMEAMDEAGMVQWIRGEGLVLLPPVRLEAPEATP